MRGAGEARRRGGGRAQAGRDGLYGLGGAGRAGEGREERCVPSVSLIVEGVSGLKGWGRQEEKGTRA